MNKKITVRNDSDQLLYCVLSGDRDLQDQINEFLFGEAKPTGGYAASLETDRIEIRDYISWCRVSSFDILSIEDTTDDLTKVWVKISD